SLQTSVTAAAAPEPYPARPLPCCRAASTGWDPSPSASPSDPLPCAHRPDHHSHPPPRPPSSLPPDTASPIPPSHSPCRLLSLSTKTPALSRGPLPSRRHSLLYSA